MTLTPYEYCPRACNACHWISKANPDPRVTLCADKEMGSQLPLLRPVCGRMCPECRSFYPKFLSFCSCYKSPTRVIQSISGRVHWVLKTPVWGPNSSSPFVSTPFTMCPAAHIPRGQVYFGTLDSWLPFPTMSQVALAQVCAVFRNSACWRMTTWSRAQLSQPKPS